jgi:hypothetical protein
MHCIRDGQTCSSNEIPVISSLHKIDLSSLPGGIYVIMIQTQDKIITRKIEKLH